MKTPTKVKTIGYGQNEGKSITLPIEEITAKTVKLRIEVPNSDPQFTEFNRKTGIAMGREKAKDGFKIPEDFLSGLETPATAPSNGKTAPTAKTRTKPAPVEEESDEETEEEEEVTEAPKRRGRPVGSGKTTSVKDPVKAAPKAPVAKTTPAAGTGRGRPRVHNRPEAGKGEIELEVPEGLYGAIKEGIKRVKGASPEKTAFSKAWNSGVAVKYVYVILNKPTAEFLLTAVLPAVENDWASSGVQGAGYRRGAKRIVSEIVTGFKFAKRVIPAFLADGATPTPKATPVKETPAPATRGRKPAPVEAPVKRGPGRPPKVVAAPVRTTVKKPVGKTSGKVTAKAGRKIRK